jgi:hypothetical protein
MDGSRTNNGPFDLFAQPFHILRVDPAVTNRQVHDAFDIAQERRLAPYDVLVRARDAILDASRRLSYELSYPIDSPRVEIDALYAALSSDAASANELLLLADRLAPLSRANFVAHIAANRPAKSAVLRAMIDAHVCIEPVEIYEILKVLRRTGGYPAPALASVNQGLQDLLDIHAQAAIAGFATSEDAIEPVLACTQQILALDERYHIGVLRSLLSAYRQSIGQQQSARIQQIEGACVALQLAPTGVSMLDALRSTLHDWVSLCRPLMAFDINQGIRERDFEIPSDLVRALIAHLSAHQQYDVALLVADLGCEVFGPMPTVVDQLDQDKRIIERMSIDAWMKPL